MTRGGYSSEGKGGGKRVGKGGDMSGSSPY